jgi:hypothetical protein
MENLQTEVLEIEFTEFSHGFKTISDLDFAEILLRYTDFGYDAKKMILRKVKKRAGESNVRRNHFFIEKRFFCLENIGHYIRTIQTFFCVS